MNAIEFLGAVISHTPVWVFAVFALLIVLGAQALRERTVPLRRVVITPAVFIVWGIVSLATKPSFSVLLVGDWLLTALVGAAIAGLALRFDGLRADRDRRLVHLPGSPFPLIRNVVIFVTKFGLGVAMATAPEAREHIAFWDVAVSGLSAGYFFGWLARLGMAYRRAPALAPSAFAEGEAAEGAL